MTASGTPDSSKKTQDFTVRVLRQDGPGQASYWERHHVHYESDMNCISVLQKIAAQSKTSEGREVAPVAWDCNCLEEVCGSCTMLINGRTRMACTALVDRLLEDNAEIELRPMSKFPVLRDLMVDRSRLLHALKKSRAWNQVDGYYDAGPGPRQSPEEQQRIYPPSECISCGCCVEACPQYDKIELQQLEGETDADFQARKEAAWNTAFIGPHAITQIVRFNEDPTGKLTAKERTDVLMQPGGIQMCGNAQNCVAVCPKSIPITRAISVAGRATTVQTIKNFFGK